MGKDKFLSHKKMKYFAAYCLLALSGKESVSEAELTTFLKSAGCEVNAENVKSVCSALAGKQLHEVINSGYGKIASLSLGGGGGQSSGGQAQQQTNTAAEVKEEVKEEAPEEEEDMDLGDLFG